MDSFDDVKQLFSENDFEAAFKALENKNLTYNQKDDLLRFKRRFSEIHQKEIKQLLSQENVSVERNKLLDDILAFISYVINGEPEIKKSLKERLFNFSFFKQKDNTEPTNLLENETDKITKNLIERYESRLEQKTDKRLPVDLKLTYTKEGTSEDYFNTHFDLIEVNETVEADWVTTLKKHKHILIVGNPGAGKSTQLLELAIAWLKDETCPQIPVIFNLAPWTKDDKHFHEWLQSALVSGYGFSKALAKEAIENNRILPLLDGLDEVGTKEETEDKKDELRSHCLDAIDRYLSLFNVTYTVICSRINEYKTAADAPIKAEILINPLTPEQIRETFITAIKNKQNLSNNDRNAINNLWQQLKIHPTLETVLCTPFYYNIALEVFENSTEQHDLPDNKEDLERYLVEAFLDKKLTNTENKRGYSEEKTRHYLGFVASVLEIENIKNFELVSFQSWYIQRYFSRFISGQTYIFTREIKSFNLNNLKRPYIWVIIIITITIIIMCSMWLSGIIIFFIEIFYKNISFTSFNWIMLIFIIPYSFLVSIYYALQDKTSFLTIENPYQRISTIIYDEIFNMFLIFTLPLFFGYFFWNRSVDHIRAYIIVIIIFTLIASIVGSTFFNHFKLRLAFYTDKKLPLKWVTFFTYATDARILEQDGGQWRFRHQILEDYFLEAWKNNN
jgi:energy-coupling factor transporter ATP-binding protein EcfA2